MAARDNYMHFRASDELTAMVNRIAAETGASKSQVLRSLIERATEGDEYDASVAAIRQAVYELSGFKKKIVRRLAMEISERIPAIIEEETAETLAS